MEISKNGKTISIRVLDYQYPERSGKGKDYDYDANWLVIEVAYTDESGTHIYYDPCLLTYELVELSDGLEKVISGKEPVFISDFMEPYLKVVFERIDGRITAAVTVTYDTSGHSWKTHKLAANLTAHQVTNLTDDIHKMINLFPEKT